MSSRQWKHFKVKKIIQKAISVSTTGFGWLRSIKLAKSVWKTESVPTSIHSFCQIGQVNEWMFIHFDNLCRLTRSTQIDKVCVEDRVSLAASQHPFIRVGDQCVTRPVPRLFRYKIVFKTESVSLPPNIHPFMLQKTYWSLTIMVRTRIGENRCPNVYSGCL